MKKKKQKTTSMLLIAIVIIVSVWMACEFLSYDIKHCIRKYKLDKIINNTYKKGVKLCRWLIEIKLED